MTSKEEKRRLKRAYKEREKAEQRRHMVLTVTQLDSLLDYVDEHVTEAGCDETLRHTFAWADRNGMERDRLADSVRYFGGYCDCEVVMNLEALVEEWGPTSR